ncbi:necrosis inducing-like protein NPP1 type [Phytophthora cinnamomi]|uniref:necrosis inducing-like protein NPP1 type n=1 Tax=Phytophthora cinnamomi TaxID=4785 RepID=UPI0035595C55|nr:necrosis inducing-like protein NPP1 type [Phytophthora cinnamomi]
MNLHLLLISAVAVAAVFSSVGAIVIDHDKVQPFAQPNPVTLTERVAIKYKPSLQILDGCHPYPAVNAAGDTSGGLKATGTASGDCTGSPLGSQVYGRSGWYKDMWAIMYAWYFPKEMGYYASKGNRHKWTAAVVWLDNPAFEKPKILAVSTIGDSGVYEIKKNGTPVCYRRYCDRPFGEYINETSPMLAYVRGPEATGIALTTVRGQGEFQDLIMWDQLTEEARSGLSNAAFAPPFIEKAFKPNLESARPFF